MKEINNPFTGQDGYNCFGCSQENRFGLKLKFFEEGEEIVSFWEPKKEFQGWKNVLHGGIQATLMDEIASWVAFVKMGTVGVTYRLSVRYMKPVYMDTGTITLRAGIKGMKRNIAEIAVSLSDGSGKLCSEGVIDYFLFPEEKARKDMFYPGKEAFDG
ncbi:MAG TPA: PaaI family thioesterase [Bacteroidaceae bacterium]|nr:PaaI family thioesterase [Bacteroidaceae bacterium]